MNMKVVATAAIVLAILGLGDVAARPVGPWDGRVGYGQGYRAAPAMMGGWGGYGGGQGYGMGPGMMGGWGGYGPGGIGYGANATPMTIEKAKEIVEQYLASTGNTDLKLAEVMEFDNNFYAGVKEKGTGTYAFELLADKYTGAIFPEFGPNMMWNTKYGHMSWGYSAQAAVTRDQAIEYAQSYLDSVLPGTKVGDADAFYGYYTIEVLKDGKIYGMLSVNGYTGAIWYHTWHREFVKILEAE